MEWNCTKLGHYKIGHVKLQPWKTEIVQNQGFVNWILNIMVPCFKKKGYRNYYGYAKLFKNIYFYVKREGQINF